MWQRSERSDPTADPAHPPRRAPEPFFYLRRLSIVVGGILTAFALESWWSGHFEHVEADANLGALRENFLENRVRLDSVSVMLKQVQSAGAELLSVAQGESPMPSADSLSSLVAGSFRLAAFKPVTSAYDNLINARDLRLVEDEELRLSLASFQSQVNWLREVERWQNEQWVFVNQIFLNESIEVSDLADDWLDAATRKTIPHARYQTDWPAALGDRKFRNIVMQRIVAADDLLRTQSVVGHQVEVILTLLDESLGTR